jgi:hypothetical protein
MFLSNCREWDAVQRLDARLTAACRDGSAGCLHS